MNKEIQEYIRSNPRFKPRANSDVYYRTYIKDERDHMLHMREIIYKGDKIILEHDIENFCWCRKDGLMKPLENDKDFYSIRSIRIFNHEKEIVKHTRIYNLNEHDPSKSSFMRDNHLYIKEEDSKESYEYYMKNYTLLQTLTRPWWFVETVDESYLDLIKLFFL